MTEPFNSAAIYLWIVFATPESFVYMDQDWPIKPMETMEECMAQQTAAHNFFAQEMPEGAITAYSQCGTIDADAAYGVGVGISTALQDEGVMTVVPRFDPESFGAMEAWIATGKEQEDG